MRRSSFRGAVLGSVIAGCAGNPEWHTAAALNKDMFATRAAAAPVSQLFTAAPPAFDTSAWKGAEYTPAYAPGNSLWLYNYDTYAAEVDFELEALSKHYGFNALRIFTHSLVYDADGGVTLFAALDKLIAAASSHGFGIGLVAFDDCWNHAGASLDTPCVPRPGVHNGCWFASPQDVDRTSVDRFQGYITDVCTRYGNNSNVLWLEMFNEPNMSDNFSLALRDAAFGWCTGTRPIAPVMSCWDDNADTQIVDVHHYDTNFPALTAQVYSNPAKGAVITEGGSRWYQGYPSDAGSPLTMMSWMTAVQAAHAAGTLPFVPGLILNWEMMVGLSNTRWHWNSQEGSPEPVIPWDAHMMPDGTPVSYTEAAAIRAWTTGANDFIAMTKFMPASLNTTADAFLTLNAMDSYDMNVTGFTDGVIETTVWPTATGAGGLLVRAQAGTQPAGYYVGFNASSMQLTMESWASGGSRTQLAEFDMTLLNCGLVTTGWNMLRVVANGSSLCVYANPMFLDASQGGVRPRTCVEDSTFASGGILVVNAGGSGDGTVAFDYVGVLPLSVL